MAGIPYDQETHYVGGMRNIVVLGRTGAGKSTLANKIICKDGVFAVGHKFQAITPHVRNAIETVKLGGEIYTINMIDTVGLQDPSHRHDSDIIKEIKRELKVRAPEGLHLIIFVFKHGRFTKEERNVFKRISDNFADTIQDLSLLVITNCDRKSPEVREKVIRQFRENPLTEKFGAMMKKGIYCVGFPDAKDINEQERPTVQREMEDDIKPIHRTITEAREVVFQEQIMPTKTCNIA